jgi:hypothetical protein
MENMRQFVFLYFEKYRFILPYITQATSLFNLAIHNATDFDKNFKTNHH